MLLLFLCLVVWTATATALVLLTLHTLYATIGLLLVVLSTSAFYWLQGAAFVAVAQVMVYGGGMLVLLLFSLMLLPPVPDSTPRRTKSCLSLLTAGILSGSFWFPSYYAWQTFVHKQIALSGAKDAVVSVGLQLLGPYAFAFEWTALSLLISLIGAVYVIKLRP